MTTGSVNNARASIWLFLWLKSWVCAKAFKSTEHNSIFNMEIFDLEGKRMDEKDVSEALALFWAQFKRLDDIEADA